MGQVLSMQKVIYRRSVALGRAFLCPGLPAIPALPANRTLGPCPRAYRLAPKVYTRGGQYLFRQALPCPISLSFLLMAKSHEPRPGGDIRGAFRTEAVQAKPS